MARSGKVYFNFCCCGIKLRLGCLLVGYFDMLGTLWYIKLLITWRIRLTATTTELEKYLSGLGSKIDPHGQAILEEMASAQPAQRGVMIFLLVLLALRVVFIIPLLVGLHTNKRALMTGYMVYFIIYFVLQDIVGIVALAYNGPPIAGVIDQWDCAGAVFVVQTLLAIYFWLVIKSQYNKMQIGTNDAVVTP